MNKNILFSVLLTLCACADSAALRESSEVNSQQARYATSQPVPRFDWSLERHLLIQLYQVRNRAVATYTYVVNPMTGRISWRCNSLGFPFAATTQLTNPEQVVSTASGRLTLPQAEPNGVFAPPDTEGTWVICTGPQGPEPVYVEENVRTFTRPMIERDGELVPQPDATSSVRMSAERGSGVTFH